MPKDGIILLAEDDENDAMLFLRAIKKAGILNGIVHVKDGEEAINYLKSTCQDSPLPSVFITDLKMPKVSGFDVLLWIRQHIDPVPFPIIVLSGSSQEEDKARALELGAGAYWVKPAEHSELVQLVEQLSEHPHLSPARPSVSTTPHSSI
jgi:CheY-like chemotaxis protein